MYRPLSDPCRPKPLNILAEVLTEHARLRVYQKGWRASKGRCRHGTNGCSVRSRLLVFTCLMANECDTILTPLCQNPFVISRSVPSTMRVSRQHFGAAAFRTCPPRSPKGNIAQCGKCEPPKRPARKAVARCCRMSPHWPRMRRVSARFRWRNHVLMADYMGGSLRFRRAPKTTIAKASSCAFVGVLQNPGGEPRPPRCIPDSTSPRRLPCRHSHRGAGRYWTHTRVRTNDMLLCIIQRPPVAQVILGTRSANAEGQLADFAALAV